MVHHREMFDRWLNVARDYPDALVDPDEDLRRRIRTLDMINHRARAIARHRRNMRSIRRSRLAVQLDVGKRQIHEG